MASGQAAKRGSTVTWLAGLLCGAVAALATPYALLAGAFLAPGLVLLLVDSAPGKPSAWPVLMIGAAALVQPGIALSLAGHHMGAAIGLATDPRGLALAWALQGLGWLGVELGPALIRLVLEAVAQSRALRLRRTRQLIEEEWGIPPGEGGAPPPEPAGR